MRSFPSDLAITSNTASALEALEQALTKHSIPEARIAARRTRAAEFNRKRKEALAKASATPAGDKITFAYLSRMVGEIVGDDAVIFNEYSMIQEQVPAREAGHVLWAHRRRRARLGLRRGARRQARGAGEARGRHARRRRLHVRQPDGRPLGVGRAQAADPDHRVQQQPATARCAAPPCRCSRTASPARTAAASWPTSPSPAFEAAVKAQGGHGERVEKASELPAALARARDVVVNEKRQALLNVICPP